MAALDAALALAELHDRAARVAGDLHLDVARARQPALDVELAAAERRGRLARAARERLGELVRRVHRSHAAAAAARDRLDHQRRTGAEPREQARAHPRARSAPDGAAQHRDAAALRERTRARLVAEQRERLGARPDEHHAGFCTATRELGVLGQEAVARVQRVAAGRMRGAENASMSR